VTSCSRRGCCSPTRSCIRSSRRRRGAGRAAAGAATCVAVPARGHRAGEHQLCGRRTGTSVRLRLPRAGRPGWVAADLDPQQRVRRPPRLRRGLRERARRGRGAGPAAPRARGDARPPQQARTPRFRAVLADWLSPGAAR
jgi:hypothetical protein